MNNQDYLQALKKALAGMERTSRDEVLQEIRSHIDESGADGATLLERFGSPETLAQQYLEGETLRTPVAKKAGGIGKKILMTVGGSVLLLIALISLLVYWFAQDDFDYANEQATELSEPGRNWLDIPLDAEAVFHVEQSKVVFYWHDAEQMRWSCKGESRPTQDEQGRYALRQKSCLIYLPKQPVVLQGNQTDITLVRPRANVELNLRQGKLRMAENGGSYQYTIAAQRSQVANFQSDAKAALQIQIKAMESDLGFY